MITWSASLKFFTPPYNVLQVTINVTDGYEEIEYGFSISVIENSTADPSSSDSSESSFINSFLIVLFSIILILIVMGMIFVLIRIKTMDKSEKKTVATVLFGSKAPKQMKDIFISYAAKDKETAFKICDMVEDSGYGCWIAPRDILPGQNWGKSIINGINNCKLMIMIFSEHSNESVQVLREIERAVHKEIPIVIFRISDIEPSEEIEYYVSAVHWLDATSDPLDEHIDDLREVVTGYLLADMDIIRDTDQEE
jgi:hypothetical protein